MLMSKIACSIFIRLYQLMTLGSQLMETLDIPKELGIFYVFLLTVPLYILWDQFITFQVTLITPPH